MFDYPALAAVAAVVETGSFERAARKLSVTPSAISQRVRQLEERLGLVLIQRGAPCKATEKGAWLCRHMEHVGMLEATLLKSLPGLGPQAGAGAAPRVTLRLAVNADSLATWFLPAAAAYNKDDLALLDIAVDDQDHTADWLRRGQVVAAVTALGRPVQGCKRQPLGALRYHATASPAYVARHFPQGVSPEAIAAAPALTFNTKDRLQSDWIAKALGREIAHPTHWLPSSQSFVDGALLGLGWGMNPAPLVKAHLEAGRLVELMPGICIDTPLDWQVNRLMAEEIKPLTRAILAAAREGLVQP
ncbi:transcriptional regulator ArgP [Xaviernesmea oryzae]|uniref:Transcriptional regulator ArgP n=1 Tax=Xaviernesmea oryzae TaxID=464029 RepID=A0A1Q9B104_9HYPH|nr:LysR family transcriptional regulator ArgP [Xaviernesmea oryzae]OLP61669.1 transcriptional regulator ArgP [Xaviernesmea oryzae]SEL03524.1 LysR family transcriptional regulator, chromosome initiation inhibitor [Xaviernesmea oryzae]